MHCPNCGNHDTKVVDSRPTDDGDAIRRRRECEKCGFRFSTYEEIEILDLTVIKREGKREPYSREKVERGIWRSFEKLGANDQTVKKIVSGVEQEIQKKAKESEISSEDIGEIISKRLKRANKVAYIRFASVYRKFADVEEFREELEKL